MSGKLTFAEVVALHLAVVVGAAEPFPVDFVEVVRLQDRRRDNAGAWGSLEEERHSAEEEVPVGLDGRMVAGFTDGELCAGGCVLHVSCGDFPGIIVGARCREVMGVCAGRETCVIGTC